MRFQFYWVCSRKRLCQARSWNQFAVRATGTNFDGLVAGDNFSGRAAGTNFAARATETDFAVRKGGINFARRVAGSNYSSAGPSKISGK